MESSVQVNSPMFSFIFHFPVGRYHATAWGRHVNEADVAWPPEPYRILRALIASYWRKGDREVFTEEQLSRLIDKLAEELPVFKLPVACHAHSRHYMPLWKEGSTALVFDAFARFNPKEPIIVSWPNLILEKKEFSLAKHLASSLGYLGRAESWVIGQATDELSCTPNAYPIDLIDSPVQNNLEKGLQNHMLAPLTPREYEEKRQHYIQQNNDKPRSKKRRQFEKTVPEGLLHALSVETIDLQEVGWSSPPASRRVLYQRPAIGPVAPRQHRSSQSSLHRQVNRPTVARYLLAGRPRPRIQEALKIGEIMRIAIMSRFGWTDDRPRRPKAPEIFSGRNEEGKPLAEDRHIHAFYLPEDADEDGEIDHVLVFCQKGFGDEACSKLDRVTSLYFNKHPGAEEENRGRKEWRLALEGIGDIKDFNDCNLLKRSRCWRPVTPYLSPWHFRKSFGYAESVRKEARLRGLPEPEVEEDLLKEPHSVLHFHRFRSRRGLHQPDRTGKLLKLTFPEPVNGPIAFGFGCHYGLGMFQAIDMDQEDSES